MAQSRITNTPRVILPSDYVKGQTMRVYPPHAETHGTESILPRQFNAYVQEVRVLTEAQRISIDLELERYIQFMEEDFAGYTIAMCVGVNTGRVCGGAVDDHNGVLCTKCWDHLQEMDARFRLPIIEALMFEFEIRYDIYPTWYAFVEVLDT